MQGFIVASKFDISFKNISFQKISVDQIDLLVIFYEMVYIPIRQAYVGF